MTGQNEQPNVQQQHKQPPINQRRFVIKVFIIVSLIRDSVALNSSGATLDFNALGKSVLNRLLIPNLQIIRNKLI